METAASSFANPVVAVRYDRISSANRAGDRVGSSDRGLYECAQPENTGPGIRGGDNDLHLHLDLRDPSNVCRVPRGPQLRRAGSPEPLTRQRTVTASLSSSASSNKSMCGMYFDSCGVCASMRVCSGLSSCLCRHLRRDPSLCLYPTKLPCFRRCVAVCTPCNGSAAMLCAESQWCQQKKAANRDSFSHEVFPPI